MKAERAACQQKGLTRVNGLNFFFKLKLLQ